MKDPVLLIPRRLGTSLWTGPDGGTLQRGRGTGVLLGVQGGQE